MTEKQQNILQAAGELFATEGYYATATSKVAKKAGVSEGLIFKHFGNKAGLLDAILQDGEKRIKLAYAFVIMQTDPKEVLRKTIEFPFSISAEEYEFWKLQYKLKWELKEQPQDKMQPLYFSLEEAFSQLGYEDPATEADFLIQLIEGFGAALLKGQFADPDKIKALTLKKYGL